MPRPVRRTRSTLRSRRRLVVGAATVAFALGISGAAQALSANFAHPPPLVGQNSVHSVPYSCTPTAGFVVEWCSFEIYDPTATPGNEWNVIFANPAPLPTSKIGEFSVLVYAQDTSGISATSPEDNEPEVKYRVVPPPTTTVSVSATGVPLNGTVTGNFACGASSYVTVQDCSATVRGTAVPVAPITAGTPLPTAIAGTYTVTSSVTDSIGQVRAEATTYRVYERPSVMVVGPAPKVALNAAKTGSFDCGAASGLMIATCTGSIEDPDGVMLPFTSGAPVPTSQPGTYKIMGEARDSLDQTTDGSVSYTVFSPPTASVTGPDPKVGQGAVKPVPFTCTAASGLTVSACTAEVESPGGAVTSIVDGDNVPTGEVGTYEITVEAEDELGQTATDRATYEVFAVPTLTLDPVAARLPVGGTVTAAYTCAATAGVTGCVATVTLPDGTERAVESGTALPTDGPGTYAVRAVVTDELGRTAHQALRYEVFAPPTVTITAPTGSAALAHGSAATFAFRCAASAGVRACTVTVIGPDGHAVAIKTGDPVPTGVEGTYRVVAVVEDDFGTRVEANSRFSVLPKGVDPPVVPDEPEGQKPTTAVPLKITKRITRTRLRPGQTTQLRVRVVNASDQMLRNVRVCERIPAGLRFVRSVPAVRVQGGERCWTIKTLKPGRYAVRTLTLRAVNRPGRVLTRTTGRAAGRTVVRGGAVRILAPARRAGGVTG